MCSCWIWLLYALLLSKTFSSPAIFSYSVIFCMQLTYFLPNSVSLLLSFSFIALYLVFRFSRVYICRRRLMNWCVPYDSWLLAISVCSVFLIWSIFKLKLQFEQMTITSSSHWYSFTSLALSLHCIWSFWGYSLGDLEIADLFLWARWHLSSGYDLSFYFSPSR